MSFFIRFIVFLVINLLTLAVGGYLQGKGPSSEWYGNLATAPWTPSGYIFGIAWLILMICFAVYMSLLTIKKKSVLVIYLFGLQIILNIIWNPIFFRFHLLAWSLLVIYSLFILLAIMFFRFYSTLKWNSFWIFPYLLLLIIAITLNTYVYFMN